MSETDGPSCVDFMTRAADFLDDGLGDAEQAALGAHLKTCGRCSQFVSEMREVVKMLGAVNLRDEAPSSANMKRIFLHWQESFRKDKLASGSEGISDLIGTLKLMNSETRLQLLQRVSATRLIQTRDQALESAAKLSSIDPIEAKTAAQIAVEVSLCLLKEEGDQENVPMQAGAARAYAILGNTRRLCSDFAGAEDALKSGFELLPPLELYASLKAKLLGFLGSLRTTQSRFDEAVRCFDDAIAIHRSEGDSGEVGRDLLAKGIALSDQGDVSGAIECIRLGLDNLSDCNDARLRLVGKHNLVYNLMVAGLFDEALDLLAETRALHAELGNAVDLARLKWLEGQIALEQDNLEQAESAFQEVRAFFARKGVAHDTALVSLDLATVYLKQRRLTELKTLAVEMLTIFEGIGTRKESQAALGFFEKAIEMEKAQMEMVGDLLEYLTALRLEERLGARLSVPT